MAGRGAGAAVFLFAMEAQDLPELTGVDEDLTGTGALAVLAGAAGASSPLSSFPRLSNDFSCSSSVTSLSPLVSERPECGHNSDKQAIIRICCLLCTPYKSID